MMTISATSREPVVLAHKQSETGIELSLVLPETLSYFSGHFPGFPVLPGVVQIDWALALARHHALIPGGAVRAIRVKFSRPIRPGTRLTLTLDYSQAYRRLQFEYRDDQFSYGSGQLELDGDGF